MYSNMLHWKAIVALFVIAISLYWQIPDGKLHIYILDVGQGDSTFIRSPFGYNIIIDGGPNLNLTDSIAKILPAHEHEIDLLILTHPHSDHMFGFMETLERYKVKNVLLTGVYYNSALYSNFKQSLAEKGVNILFASSLKDIYFNDGLLLDIIYPQAPSLAVSPENVNNDSVVLRLKYGENTMLFTGDAEIEEEEHILKTPYDLSAHILKAGHHGSKTSSSDAYLDAVAPKYATISAGKDNSYHHPHTETLNKYAQRGIESFRTDLEGTIEMVFAQFLHPS